MSAFGQRYVPVAVLGQGGEATVFLARSSDDATLVVQKRLRAHLDDTEPLKRFERELRLGRHLRHPNIAALLHGAVDAEGRFLVFEYVDGVSLQRMIDDAKLAGAPLPTGVVLSIVLDVLAGLEAAHGAHDDDGRALGIVHRDVSPHNVVVGRDGRARLIDFGVAETVADERITPLGTRVGKLSYMAPEYIVDDRADARSDVYSTAVTAWTALARRRPWESSTDAGVLLQVCERGVPPLVSAAPHVAPEVAAAIDRAAARAPADRPQSAALFATELRAVACGDATHEAVAAHMRRYDDELEARVHATTDIVIRGPAGDHTVVGGAIAARSSRAGTDEITRRDALTSPSTRVRRAMPLAGRTIVLVDDMAESLDLVGLVLERAGAIVPRFENADAALRHIATARPDLLISDLAMPGHDGFWLVHSMHALGEAFADIPAIALSACNSVEDELASRRAGFFEHVAKPTDPAKLVAVASALLRQAVLEHGRPASAGRSADASDQLIAASAPPDPPRRSATTEAK